MAQEPDWHRDFGNASPDLDPVGSQRYWYVGDIRQNTDSTSPIVQWICTVEGRPGTWVPRYGGLGGDATPRVGTIALLAAIDCSGYASTQAHLAEVLSVGDMFLHHPTGGRGTWSVATTYAAGDIVYHPATSKAYIALSASTAQTPTIVPSAFWKISMTRIAAVTGTHLWERMAVANPTWKSKRYWAVDPAAGDDEAVGWGTSAANAQLVPLQTVAEYARRVGICVYRDTAPEIWIMSDVPDTDDTSLNDISTTGNLFINIAGVRTILRAGSALTGVVNPGTGNGNWQLTDSSIASTWSNAGPSGSSLISSSTRACLIEKTTGNVRAWISEDLGSKTIEVGQPFANTCSPPSSSTSTASFVGGDTCQVVTFPIWPRASSRNPFINYYGLQHKGTGSATLGRFNAFGCSFLNSSVSFQDRTSLTACCLINATTRSATGLTFTMAVCLLIGGTIEPTCPMIWNGFTNTFKACLLLLYHGADLNSSGTIVLLGGTSGIQLYQGGRAVIQNIRGTSTTYIIQLLSPDTKVTLLGLGDTYGSVVTTGLTATTSLAHPITFQFTPAGSRDFDYTDLPRWNDTFNGGILGG